MVDILKDAVSLGIYAAAKLLMHSDNKEVVLLYHSVNDTGSKNDYFKSNLAPAIFKKQLEFLAGFKKQNVIITFDDGFSNFFDIVFPLVAKYNIKAILFITSGFIDGLITREDIFSKKLSYKKPLNWSQVKEVSNAGVEIGSHSLTHLNLLKLDTRAVYAEISDSKKRIEDIIGKEVKYFAYPYGSRNTFDNRIKQIIKDSGYKKAYTNIMGFNTQDTDLYELKRIRILGNDNMFRFKLKINGAYNWIDFFNFKSISD